MIKFIDVKNDKRMLGVVFGRGLSEEDKKKFQDSIFEDARKTDKEMKQRKEKELQSTSHRGND